MKANHLRAIALVIIFVPVLFLFCYIYECVYSAFRMESKITFSAMMIPIAISTLLIYYIFYSTMYYCIIKKNPKYNDLIYLWLLRIAFTSMLFGPFTSMYITYKAMHNGYIECEKISWMSPNNFVKPPETCN